MNYITRLLILTFCLTSLICCSNKEEFVLQGTTTQDRLEGEYVFLVPLEKNIKDEIGVDSAIIKDHKFKFVGNREFIGRLTIDYKIRLGLQELLVITEPGTTNIILDSLSSSYGTPQNDALQAWKEMKQTHDHIIYSLSSEIYNLKNKGDTISANHLADSLKSEVDTFRQISLNMADSIGGTLSYMMNKILNPKN